MSKEIKPIPELRKEILEAINNKKLIIFIGAGVSALTGLPLWNQLADKLVKNSIEEKCISFNDAEIVFSKIQDAKQKISIVYELFDKNGKLDKFYNYLTELLSCDKANIEAETIFKFCEWANATVLTTNADVLLDEYYQKELIHSDLSEFVFKKNYAALYKIHGSITDKRTLVFTAEQYLKRYSKDSFKDFLSKIFASEYTVLFIGYGMSEFELLEFMIKPEENSNRKHFFLSPYFSYEKPLMESMDLYYQSLGIDLIPYSRDENDYKQLAILINEWQKEIESKTDITGIRIQQIKQLLIDHNNLTQICQIIKQYDYAERYFLNELKNVKELDNWIRELLKTELFDPKVQLKKCLVKNDGWLELNLLEFYIENYNNDEIIAEIINKLNKIIIHIINNPEYITIPNLSHVLFNLLTKFDDNIIGEVYLSELIDLIYDKSNKDLDSIIYNCESNIEYITHWDELDINVLVESIINRFNVEDNNNKFYWIKTFYEGVFSKLINSISSRTFEILVEWLSKVEEKNPYKFMSIGSFAEEYDKKFLYSENLIIIVIRMIKDLIRNKNAKIGNFISNSLSEKEFITEYKIIKKLCIYIIAIYFDTYKNVLFNLRFNPFFDWSLYGDLYYLIEINIDSITYDEAHQLYNWIVESDYNGKTEEYQKIIKYDFLDLLSKKYDEFNQQKRKFASKFHDEVPTVYERNKVSRLEVHSGPDNKDIIEEMSKMNFDEITEYLSSVEIKGWHTEYDYQKAFQTIIESNQPLILSNIKKVNKLPYWCLTAVVDCLERIIKSNEINVVFDLINHLYETAIQTKDYSYLLWNILRILNSEYVKEGVGETELEMVELFTKKIIETTKDYFNYEFDFREYKDYDEASFIINNWFASCISTLLKISCFRFELNKNDNVLDYCNKLYKQFTNDAKKFIKHTLLYYFRYIFFIDKSEANKIINKFIDDYDSATIFMYSNVQTFEAYKRLQEIGYIDYLFSNDSIKVDESIKYTIAYWCIKTSIQNNYDVDKDLKNIINSNNNNVEYYIFHSLADAIEANENRALIRKLLKKACSYINEAIDNDMIKSSDQIMRYLSKDIMLLDSVDSKYWNCLEKLSLKFDSYLSQELHDLLIKNYAEKKRSVIAIVKNIVTESKWYVFGFERGFDDLILMIKNDPESIEDFYSINTILVKENITRFTDNN